MKNNQNKEPSYLDHIIAFDERLADGQFKELTSADIALYKALLAICNKISWSQFGQFTTEFMFQVYESDLKNRSHLNHRTILKSRDQLMKSGLIAYTRGFNGGSHTGYSSAKYSIMSIDAMVQKCTMESDDNSVAMVQKCTMDMVQKCTMKPDSHSAKMHLYKDIEEICKREIDTHIFPSDEEKDLAYNTLVDWLSHIEEKNQAKGKSMTPVQMKSQIKRMFDLFDRHGVKKVAQTSAKAQGINFDWIDDKLVDDFNGQDKHQEKIVPSAHYIEN